ncbi:MAG: RNA pseudouridine synthase [Mycoplasmoidaceae bacterium]|nr:RNA pseudouridine synthase [Mycoplasmoidaceae bacterium]
MDRNTTGLVLAAKNAESLRILNEKLKNHEIKKTYLARVNGIIDPKQGTLRHYLTKNSKTKMVRVTKNPVTNESKQIITEYKTISHDKQTSLLEINLITGKTHQIRAHFAYIGHPLVGERKYTNKSVLYRQKNKYQQLCAYKIKFAFSTPSGILNYLTNKEFKIPYKEFK